MKYYFVQLKDNRITCKSKYGVFVKRNRKLYIINNNGEDVNHLENNYPLDKTLLSAWKDGYDWVRINKEDIPYMITLLEL